MNSSNLSWNWSKHPMIIAFPVNNVLRNISDQCSSCLHRWDYDEVSQMWICESGPNSWKLSRACNGFKKEKEDFL